MEIEEQLELTRKYVEEIEDPMRERLADIALEHGMNISMNVAVSIGTSLMATALTGIQDEMRQLVMELMVSSIESKLKDSESALETAFAIHKAKGRMQ